MLFRLYFFILLLLSPQHGGVTTHIMFSRKKVIQIKSADYLFLVFDSFLLLNSFLTFVDADKRLFYFIRNNLSLRFVLGARVSRP